MTIRIRRTRGVQTPDSAQAEELLKSIATLQKKASEAEAALKKAEAELFDTMTKCGLTSVSYGASSAEIVRSAGKATNVIDIKALHKKLPLSDFLECVTVSVTKAKEMVAAKELAAITSTIPGKVGEPKLKVTIK